MSNEAGKICVVSKGEQVFIGLKVGHDSDGVMLEKARDVSAEHAVGTYVARCGLVDCFDIADEVMDEIFVCAPDLVMKPSIKIRKQIAQLFGYTIAADEQKN